MPKRTPIEPVPSESALDFIRKAEDKLGRARIEKLSEQEIESELSRLAGGREDLEAIKRRIMMDIFKRPQQSKKDRR